MGAGGGGGATGVLTSAVGTAAVLAGRGVVRGVCTVRTGRGGRYLVPGRPSRPSLLLFQV